jgi:ketosteroid isomerase-like protein
MHRGIVLFWLLLTFAAADLRTSWESLVNAERAFAETSVEKGTKPAFLAVLAEDSIIFRPRAVPGKKWMQENPAAAGQLNWTPEFADIAASGDLGYTTGPWEFRRNPQDVPVAFGHYVTLWRKQSDGAWKVEIDIGIGHDKIARPNKVESPSIPKEVAAAKPKPDLEKSGTALVKADHEASAAVLKYLAADTRLYREGALPLVGDAAARDWLSKHPDDVNFEQSDVKIANAADLGYSFGATPNANYLRIWKKQRDGSWKIVLDLMSPVPKAAN